MNAHSPSPDLRAALRAATGAAERAARLVLEAGRLSRDEVDRKGAVNLVTRVDRACEEAIRERLAAFDPGLPVLGEEAGGAEGARTRWIVDPLDGTTNFVHGFPAVAVSIALELDGELVLGCVRDVFGGALYTALAGSGARRDGRPIRVSRVAELGEALLLSGFGYDRRERAAAYLAYVRAALERAQGFRRCGAAALDLCRLAEGRADAFWEFGLQPWDVAAGAVLVREAGGRISGADGGPLDLFAAHVAASNGLLHEPLLALLAEVRGGRPGWLS